VVHGELIARRDLPGEALPPLGAVPELRVRHEVVRGDPAPRGEEPQRILFDRPAESDVDVFDEIDAIALRQAASPQLVGDVVALPLAGAAARKGRTAELVAALRGIMLIFTPPVDTSAPMPLVW
jgi:hypothetical protein